MCIFKVKFLVILYLFPFRFFSANGVFQLLFKISPVHLNLWFLDVLTPLELGHEEMKFELVLLIELILKSYCQQHKKGKKKKKGM